MENGTAPNTIPTHKTNLLIILLPLLTLISGFIGGYFVKDFLTPKDISITTPVVKTESNQKILSSVTYLQQFLDIKAHTYKTVLIANEPDATKLILSETNLNPQTFKIIHSFGLGACGFSPPVYSVNNFMIALYSGGDYSDIVIFSLDGSVVTTSVKEFNPELNNWVVSYEGKKDEKEPNHIVLKLFKIDGQIGEVTLDVTTGKIIPGTLKTL